MANANYATGRNAFLTGALDWVTDTFKIVLRDLTDDAFNAADEDLADVLAGSRVATSSNLAGKTAVGGFADCTDPVFTAVTGDQSEGFAVYNDTGVEATSLLITHIDTVTSGLPFTPNGGDLSLQLHATGLYAI